MRLFPHLLLAAVGAAAILGIAALGHGAREPTPSSIRPELEYLKIVNRARPPSDPQLIFLLMAQYANAGRAREGAEFFASLTEQFAPGLSDAQKALYLSATALLRAQAAPHVSLLSRLSWVGETLAMLDRAQQLSRGEIFIVRWISGVVRAQLPGFFRERARAIEALQWCLEHSAGAPHPGWLREVHYQLAALYRGEDGRRSTGHLRASGYKAFDKAVTIVTPFIENPAQGHAFSARRIEETVPGRVYTLSGFEFTEYYFVVTDDGEQLVGIDAGTRPDSAKTAYEALRHAYPKLPPLTTVLVTHAHWDHVGGHRYFRSIDPAPLFIAHSAWREEIEKDVRAPATLARPLFGARFDLEDVRTFKPDATVERRVEFTLGGTRVELIPVRGGETHDALLIHLPDLGVLFAGDFIMPYLGAPFVEEGDFDGLLEAIDVVVERRPRLLLHGHEPLTRLFNSPRMLADMKGHLAWLGEQVQAGVRNGTARSSLHNANLIPPHLLEADPATHLPYLVMRENVINRLYDQHVGYWQPDLQGVDHLSRADRGSALVDYLGVSERQVVAAARRLIDDGRHELAADLVESTRGRFAESAGLARVERLAYLKLKEKYQDINPFKYILYSARIGDPTPAMETGK